MMNDRPFVINQEPLLVGEIVRRRPAKKRRGFFQHPADGVILCGLTMLASTLCYWAAHNFLYVPTLSVSSVILIIAGLFRAFVK